jgi:hypothetical protein
MRDHPELLLDIVFDGLFDGLRRAGIAFSLADTSVPEQRLANWRVALLVSFECLSRPLMERLFDWVSRGRTLVVGPRLPRWDWAGAPLGLPLPEIVKGRVPSVQCGSLRLEDVDLMSGAEPVLESEAGVLAAAFPFGKGSVIAFGFRLPWQGPGFKPDGLAEIVCSLLAPAKVGPCYPASDPVVETELYEGGERRFLFIANPDRTTRNVTIQTDPREALREVRGGGRHIRAGERLVVPPASVLLREVVTL